MTADTAGPDAYALLLPQPVEARATGGELRLDGNAPLRVRVTGGDEARISAGLTWAGVPTLTDGDATVQVHIGADGYRSEAYRLDVTADGVVVEAGSVVGAGHALTTLRQLAAPGAWRRVAPETLRIPCGTVKDEPALTWRGGLLDPSRHFLPKQVLLRYVDLFAAHKLNVLHLHLSDDQGWRVESERYPEITRVATHRDATQVGHGRGDGGLDGTPHGGYYRLDDLREIAEYARRQGVTVLPEIDLPGHTSALLAALPELGPGGEVRERWGISDVMVRPTPEALTVVTTLLDEVIEACRPPMLHLGGDECRASAWERDPVASAHLREQGQSVQDGYAAVVATLAGHLSRRGVRPVVWEEAFLGGGLPQDAVVVSWRGETAAELASADGHDVVLAPVMPCYFDYYQADSDLEPLAIGGPVTLDDVGAYDPGHRPWTSGDQSRVLGTQFCAWSEYIPGERQLDYMAFPRASVLADAAWRGTASGLRAGDDRLAAHLRRLDAMGVEYRPLDGPHPWQQGGSGNRRFVAGPPMQQSLVRLQALATSGLIEGDEPDASVEQ